jgi:hypothetical protein
MPTGTNEQHTQDWDAVNVGKSGGNWAQKPKTARGIDQAKASGKLATEKRCVTKGEWFHSLSLMDGLID